MAFPKTSDDYERVPVGSHRQGDTPSSTAHSEPEDFAIRGGDSLSMHSTTPLAPRVVVQPPSFPPPQNGGRAVEGMPMQQMDRPKPVSSNPALGFGYNTPQASNWDLLGGIRKFEQDYEHFDTRNANEEHLRFAEGDVPNNKVCICASKSSALFPKGPFYSRCPNSTIIF